MKYLLIIPILLMVLTSGANAEACTSKNDCDCWCKQHPESPICTSCPKQSGSNFINQTNDTTFTVTGTYCANPYDSEGPNYPAAIAETKRKALRQCYPFQIKRMTNYEIAPFKGCQNYFGGSQARAGFTCAH